MHDGRSTEVTSLALLVVWRSRGACRRAGPGLRAKLGRKEAELSGRGLGGGSVINSETTRQGRGIGGFPGGHALKARWSPRKGRRDCGAGEGAGLRAGEGEASSCTSLGLFGRLCLPLPCPRLWGCTLVHLPLLKDRPLPEPPGCPLHGMPGGGGVSSTAHLSSHLHLLEPGRPAPRHPHPPSGDPSKGGAGQACPGPGPAPRSVT